LAKVEWWAKVARARTEVVGAGGSVHTRTGISERRMVGEGDAGSGVSEREVIGESMAATADEDVSDGMDDCGAEDDEIDGTSVGAGGRSNLEVERLRREVEQQKIKLKTNSSEFGERTEAECKGIG